ncbi:MAG: alpha/beta fold hydrolase [Pirellulales bacterium]|nr:alpha/beta fold hydrolase [Pirellulales bacterium]
MSARFAPLVLLLALGQSAWLAADEPPPFYPDKLRLLVYRDASGVEHPIDRADAWPRRREHILLGMQQAMGPLPGPERRTPLELAIETETDVDGFYTRRRIHFTPEPGDSLPGWLLVPKQRNGRLPAVLCLHQTIKIGKDEPVGLGDDPNKRYADELARRGYVTLAVDYPNFGTYEFDPYAHGYVSATMKGIWNHLRAVDLLCALPEVDARRIGVIGHSLGGHNSLFVAAFDPRIRCVVTSCGFNSFRHYYGGDLTGWSHKGYMPRIADVYGRDPARMPFDFPEVLAAIAPRAVLVVAPQRDANFAVEGVRECVTAAQTVYALLGIPDRLRALYPDAEHNFPPAERQAAYAWMDQWLVADQEP